MWGKQTLFKKRECEEISAKVGADRFSFSVIRCHTWVKCSGTSYFHIQMQVVIAQFVIVKQFLLVHLVEPAAQSVYLQLRWQYSQTYL